MLVVLNLLLMDESKILEDAETKKIIWYDLLSSIFSGPDDPNYVVCKVTPNRIEYYTMNMPKPEIWQA